MHVKRMEMPPIHFGAIALPTKPRLDLEINIDFFEHEASHSIPVKLVWSWSKSLGDRVTCGDVLVSDLFTWPRPGILEKLCGEASPKCQLLKVIFCGRKSIRWLPFSVIKHG